MCRITVSYFTVIVLDTALNVRFAFSFIIFICLPLIHFFARQRNEPKKGDTGETLCNPFSRFSPVTPIRYDGINLFGLEFQF